MNKNKRTALLISTILYLVFSCKDHESGVVKYVTKTNILNEIDGPYIYDKDDSLSIITVEQDIDSSFFILKQTLKREDNQQFTCHVNNSDKDSFTFRLRDTYKTPKGIYDQPEKLFVISDIEGNFNAFYSLLMGGSIMDKNYKWTFGSGHLVICGDMIDRGNNSWPCLWLLYKLEQDAENAGGKVHYILGNHDVMNMHANLKYVKRRHIELAKILSGKDNEKEAWLYLLSDANEIAKWIASKNTIEKIGNAIYLHGGISEDVVDAGLTIEKINDIVRKNIRNNLTNYPGNNELDNLVLSRFGPLWYRGLVKNYKEHYEKIDSKSLDLILQYFNVNQIIIGHTIVDDEITSDYNGRVIRVNMKHSYEKFTGKSQGLLIEDSNYFKVNDSGEKSKLLMN